MLPFDDVECWFAFDGQELGGGSTYAEFNRLLNRGYRVHRIERGPRADHDMIILTSDPVVVATRALDDKELKLRAALQSAYAVLFESSRRLSGDAYMTHQIKTVREQMKAALFPPEEN